jgi:hypothetical protein
MNLLKQYALVSMRKVSLSGLALAPLMTLLALTMNACSGGSANIPAATASGPQLYMAPAINGGTPTAASAYASSLSVFSVDHTALSFAQKTYALNSEQSGPQLTYSGDLASPGLARGLEELELTYASGTTYNQPQAGSGWAVELAGQSGGLAQLADESFVPLVPAVTCPSTTSTETFLFVTLPALLLTTGTGTTGTVSGVWNPQIETAYGSADISANGSTVTLANIKQNILPSEGGGTPANAPSSSVTGTCSSTLYGNTVAVPANPTITIDPTGTITTSPQALIGIGPSGLLVENNGTTGTSFSYENVLGAGTGAIGLPKPSQPLDTGSMTSAQYLGFFFGSGLLDVTGGFNQITNGFSSAASFGFPAALQSSCSTIAAQTGTLVNGIYGGDFPVDTRPGLPTTGLPNPGLPSVQSNGGYGNCDFAIDLGAQDTSTNGLFPAATVYVGSGFGTNTTGYSFPAVAIAGQLNEKFAVFLIGTDSAGTPNQAWGIYLLQSN